MLKNGCFLALKNSITTKEPNKGRLDKLAIKPLFWVRIPINVKTNI